MHQGLRLNGFICFASAVTIILGANLRALNGLSLFVFDFSRYAVSDAAGMGLILVGAVTLRLTTRRLHHIYTDPVVIVLPVAAIALVVVPQWVSEFSWGRYVTVSLAGLTLAAIMAYRPKTGF